MFNGIYFDVSISIHFPVGKLWFSAWNYHWPPHSSSNMEFLLCWEQAWVALVDDFLWFLGQFRGILKDRSNFNSNDAPTVGGLAWLGSSHFLTPPAKNPLVFWRKSSFSHLKLPLENMFPHFLGRTHLIICRIPMAACPTAYPTTPRSLKRISKSSKEEQL